ncbi:hypothetical protein H633G_11472 [Metarhizium anisopliae BRIP 53284]|nr:hypothetical protein H633G_11472 [Metarhizium anisopliae BRIP 53284]
MPGRLSFYERFTRLTRHLQLYLSYPAFLLCRNHDQCLTLPCKYSSLFQAVSSSIVGSHFAGHRPRFSLRGAIVPLTAQRKTFWRVHLPLQSRSRNYVHSDLMASFGTKELWVLEDKLF